MPHLLVELIPTVIDRVVAHRLQAAAVAPLQAQALGLLHGWRRVSITSSPFVPLNPLSMAWL